MPSTTTEIATFAAGCFGVSSTSSTNTLKTKGLPLKWDILAANWITPTIKNYETLTEFFYKMHDPTTLNEQGPEDIGTQYRSAIFYHSDAHKAIAEKVTQEVQAKHYPTTPIVTEITAASTFYNAEDYHQLYLANNPEGYAVSTLYLEKYSHWSLIINQYFYFASVQLTTFAGKARATIITTLSYKSISNISIFIFQHIISHLV
ncbi:unnamed protein product [Mucor hiemalis]